MELNFADALKAGLASDSRVPVNAQVLDECYAVQATPYGIKPFPALTQPFSEAYLTAMSIDPVWPFPQIIMGNKASVLADKTDLYTIARGAKWVLAALPVYTMISRGRCGRYHGGGTWHFMDFYDTWALFNGACTVFWRPFSVYSEYGGGGVFGPRAMVQSYRTINTACAFREGRAIYGGFNPSTFEDKIGDFLTDLSDLPRDMQVVLEELSGTGPGNNWVWWSSIGGGDLYSLFNVTGSSWVHAGVGVTNDTDGDDGFAADGCPYWLDYLRKNLSGMRPMPWQGWVNVVKPVGDAVMVYGDNGAAALVPFSSPAPTFGLRMIDGLGYNIGCMGRGAVAGDGNGHVFLDNAGELWHVKPSLEAERLGYGNVFSQWLVQDKTNVSMSYDPQYHEVYISNGSETFVLGKGGLSQRHTHPTNIAFIRHYATGSIRASGVYAIQLYDSDANAVVETHEFDGGSAALWEMVVVQTTGADWHVTVQYEVNGAWLETEELTPIDGLVFPRVCGNRFKLSLRHATPTTAELDGLSCVLEAGGRRAVVRLLEAA